MKSIFIIPFAIAGTFFAAANASQKSAPPDESLQGKWNIVSMPPGWKRVPGVHVEVTPDTAKVYMGAIRTTQLRYTIDPAQKAIDATRVENGKTVVQLGTYRLFGETLKVSVSAPGKPRPGSPDASDGGAMPWVFRRTTD